MDVLIFIVLLGLAIALAPYILGALVIAAGIMGGAIVFTVVFIKEMLKDRRR